MKDRFFFIALMLCIVMPSLVLGQLNEQDYTELKNIIFENPEIVNQPKLAFVIEQNDFEDKVYFMLNYKDKKQEKADELYQLRNSFKTWLNDQYSDLKESPIYKESLRLQNEYDDLSNQINGAVKNMNSAMNSYRLCMIILGDGTCNGHIQNAKKHESRQKQLINRANNIADRLNAFQNQLARSSGLTDVLIEARQRRKSEKEEVLVKEINELIDARSSYKSTIFDIYMNADESFKQFKIDRKLKREKMEKATTKSGALDILKKIKDN
jgi:hypothetical protein